MTEETRVCELYRDGVKVGEESYTVTVPIEVDRLRAVLPEFRAAHEALILSTASAPVKAYAVALRKVIRALALTIEDIG